MNSVKRGKIIKYIEEFLNKTQNYWYSQKNVIFKLVSQYDDFDEMLKRELLCTQFEVKELILNLNLRVYERGERLQIKCCKQ